MAKRLIIVKDTKAIESIMINAYTSLLISSDIYYKQQSLFVIHSTFFKYTRAIHYRMAIIELHKIFSESTHDRNTLELLFKHLIDGRYELKTPLDSEKIEIWKTKWTSYIDTIDKIRVLRNRHYAHTIAHFANDLPEIEFDVLFDLVKFISSITNTLMQHQGHLIFEYEIVNHQYLDYVNTMHVFDKRDEIYRAHELMKTDRPLPNF